MHRAPWILKKLVASKNVWSPVKVAPTSQGLKKKEKFRHFEFSKEMYTTIVKNVIIKIKYTTQNNKNL